MSLHNLREYSFRNTSQWQAGVSRNWSIAAEGLRAPPQLRAMTPSNTVGADANSAPAFDTNGELAWVRPGTFELMREKQHGVTVADPLQIGLDASVWQPRELVVGRTLVWLLLATDDETTNRHLIAVALDSLQATTSVDPQWQIDSIAAAEEDGLWAIARRRGDTCLVSISRAGAVRRLATLEIRANARLARIPSMNAVVVLNTIVDTACPGDCFLWRVLLIDLECAPVVADDDIVEIYCAERKPVPCPDHPPNFIPNLITVDCHQSVYVADKTSGNLMAISLCGESLGRWRDVFDRCQLPLIGLESLVSLVAAGSAGVYRIATTQAQQELQDTAESVYLTPVLVSPDGVVSGWSRLDLQVQFGGHSRLQVRVAHTSDPQTIDRIAVLQRDTGTSADTRLRRLVDILPWDAALTTEYVANFWPAGRPLRLPLHSVGSTHLWLMITLRPDSEAPPAVIRSLRVAYPNLSYSSYLPAVFQEDATGAAHLRSLLSVLESVFGDLDEMLAELPANIDPRTAPAEWVPHLLRWLGLPVATELSVERQRRLLLAAPELLRWRGTRNGLRQLLKLLLDDAFRIDDLATGPAPWALPVAGRQTYGQRLGRDTLVLCAAQPGFTAGNNAVLGRTLLGFTSLSTRQLIARRSASLCIVIASSNGDNAKTEALLGRFLPYFVPAHCRYQIAFVDAGRLPMPTFLSATTEFSTPGAARVGASLVLGNSRLTGEPIADTGIMTLDSNTVMNSGDYLT